MELNMILSNDFEKIAKRRKNRSLVRNSIISLIISILALSVSYVGLNRLNSQQGKKIQDYFSIISEIAYPNVSYSSWGYYPSLQFTGVFRSTRFKDIDGIEVPFESFEVNYSLWSARFWGSDSGLKSGDQGQSLYTHRNHNKVPLFFVKDPIGKDYSMKPTQDIPLLKQLPNQAVEVAITFNKPYTLKEIQKVIPENLKINWIWIGSDSDLLIENSLVNQFGFHANFDLGLSAQQQNALNKEVEQALAKNKDADIEAIYQKFEKKQKISPLIGMENSYSVFKENAQKYLALDHDFSTTSANNGKVYSTQKQLKEYLKHNSDPHTARFAGLIVTGRSEHFKELENKDWIFASNIGESVEIKPYHQLTK
ncbi:anti sigma factor C-terminal domain-containing protein [Streptococcus iniae]